MAHTAPHWPLHARPEDISKYKGKYNAGWEVLRKERYQRMVELKLIDPATCQLLPNSSEKAWADCQDKETEVACMTVHAAMVDRVDQGIGRIIQKLKDTGQYENTILFFMSDNGASYERGYPAGFDRPGFTRDSTMIDYNSKNPGSETTWNYLGNAWANAVNTPFRFWKMEAYEGGTCTPMIVNWPKGLKKQQNTINRGVGHVIDILPTCLNLAGVSYPSEINGLNTELPDGKDLMPMILGETNSVHDTLFWEHQGGKAIRVGDWKMSARKESPWEIFNLAKDRNEAINLAGQFPDKEKELDAAWEKWALKMKINKK